MPQSIEYILFDLDNTLYSSHLGLEDAVNVRVNDYLAEFFNMSKEKAWALRKEQIKKGGYGTTLEWLRTEQGIGDEETEKYLAHMHPGNEADILLPDPHLREFLLSFSSRNIPIGILTNSTMEHALRILGKLKITDLFHTIFDIRKNEFIGKPNKDIYHRILSELGTSPSSCLFIDDIPFYAEGYRKIGGLGVLLDEDNLHPEFPGYRIQKLEEILKLRRPDGNLLFH